MTTVHAQTGIKLATKPAKTSLLGGHFIYKANGTTETPSSANVVEYVDNNPALWGHNVHIGSNGIKLRYDETTLSKWDTNSLIFYIPTTTNGVTTTTKGLQLSSAGLEIFGSSQSTADLTATSNGINIGKGSIVGADNTVTNYVPDTGFLYLSTKNYGSYLNIADSGNRTDWRLVVGNHFGVTKDGNVYMNAATVSGKIVALTGQIGGTYVGDSWGWTLSTGQLYTGTIGTDNSLHMRSFNLSSDVSINGESRKDWRLTVGSKFGVTKNGEIFATDANLSGTINANEGSIGAAAATKKIKIGTDTTNASIYYGMDSLASTNDGFYIGTDGISVGGGKFKVTAGGQITATGLSISASDIEGVLTRNYVVNGFFNDATLNSPWSKESSATLSYSNGMLVITCSSSYYGIYQTITLEPNTKYVLSCDAGSSFQLGFGASNTWPTYTGTWTTASDGRKYRIVETSSGTTYRIYAYATNTSPCYINRIKLEIGEEYTGWYAEGNENTEGGYITDITDNGIQITSKGNSGNYLTLDSSNGMRIYESGYGQTAQLGKIITLGNASGSTGANFNTVITSDTFSINTGRNPSFMIQSTGDQQQVETRVLAQQAFSVNSSSQKTKTWNLQLKALTASPYTYTLAISGGVSTTFTVSPSTYNTPSTLSTTVMGSQNTVSLTVNKVNYVSGSIDSIDVTVTQVAKVSTIKAGKVFYSGVWITYSSLVYTTAIAWNGSDIFNLGEVIAVNGGTDYTTDVSVTSSPETVRSIGSITLDEGVYVCSVLARFVPTTRTAGTVCHTRMNLNTVSGNTSAQSIVCNTTSGGSASASAGIIWNWNQHNATFIANVTMAEGATYYVNVSSDVPGVWKRDTSIAFSIRAVKIK